MWRAARSTAGWRNYKQDGIGNGWAIKDGALTRAERDAGDIITKKKHGFGLPFGPWLNNEASLRALAADALNGVKRRGIVRNDFVYQLLTVHLPSHPGFYGTMVWLLMMLEFWYRHHVDTSS